ncbi:glycerol kinase 2 [Clostridia bacterium]|nr:glycerol kinase 2 [Clostridia bacterium]
MIDQLKANGKTDFIRNKTGLVPDAYFSATKLAWLLRELNLTERAKRGELCFGTVDSYLMWHMLSDRPHVTDVSNASRTMLMNLRTLDWDEELLQLFDIPREILPTIKDTIGEFGVLDPYVLGASIPVTAVAGDQQAALFGQACFTPGMTKNTYGTGCFVLQNTGNKLVIGDEPLLASVAWKHGSNITYALEGSVFIGGAAIQWLRDELKIITSADETEELARSIPDNQGVYLVPAFSGLGAPYWDSYARGTLIGMTRGTGRSHFARAALESIAYQSKDALDSIERASGLAVPELRVDGGASANNLLMQFQADMLDRPVLRPKTLETTALGAAWMAGVGAEHDMDAIKNCWQADLTFHSTIKPSERDSYLSGWRRAVKRSMQWANIADD